MSFPFADMLHEEISWEARVVDTYDEHGQPTYNTGATLRCRISHKTKLVRTITGEEKVSNATVYIEGNPGIKPEDRITFPDDSQPIVLVAKTFTDDIGSKHQEVMV